MQRITIVVDSKVMSFDFMPGSSYCASMGGISINCAPVLIEHKSVEASRLTPLPPIASQATLDTMAIENRINHIGDWDRQNQDGRAKFGRFLRTFPKSIVEDVLAQHGSQGMTMLKFATSEPQSSEDGEGWPVCEHKEMLNYEQFIAKAEVFCRGFVTFVDWDCMTTQDRREFAIFISQYPLDMILVALDGTVCDNMMAFAKAMHGIDKSMLDAAMIREEYHRIGAWESLDLAGRFKFAKFLHCYSLSTVLDALDASVVDIGQAIDYALRHRHVSGYTGTGW